MSIYDTLGSSMSGNRLWMETIANNITNVNTTRTKNGGPYQRQTVIFQEKKSFNDYFQQELGTGVEVKKVVSQNQDRIVYQPEHPDANEEGFVRFPSINLIAEYTNLISAQRGYEGAVTTYNSLKEVSDKTLEIGK